MAETPRIVRLHPNGPNGEGLAPLDLDPADFQSPLPQQNFHLYFSDSSIGLNVGVWDTTTMQEAFGPYPGDEFVLVLDGAFNMIDSAGDAVGGRSGEMVAFRNGAPMSWKQEGYLKKFYLTLNDPAAGVPKIDTAEDAVVVIDPATRLSDADTLADDNSSGSGAVAREVIFFKNDTGTMSVGLWDCQAFDAEELEPFPCHEFVVMAAGEVTIKEPGGIAQTFGPGDAFFVPKGTLCSWHVPTYIRKFYAAVEL